MSPPVSVTVASADSAQVQRWAFAVRDALWRNGEGSATAVETAVVNGGHDRLEAWLAADVARGNSGGRVLVANDLDTDLASNLLCAGGSAVLSQPHPKWLLRHAVAVAGSGGLFLDPWLAHDLADTLRPRRGNLHGVTGGEQRVLSAASRGLDVRAIASVLQVSPDTVKGHLRSAQHRLGVGRKELIRTARTAGLMPAGSGRSGAEVWDASRGLQGISVFVVSPERLARETLIGTLRAAGAQVIGQGVDAEAVAASDADWTVTLVISHGSDGALLDLKAARPGAALAIIPWVLNARAVQGALAARAQAVVGVDAHLDELIVGLRLAASGGLYFHSSALRVALKVMDQTRGHPTGPLTVRQRDVLSLADRGLTNREIARELGLAEPTVKGHVRAALRLLEAASRHEGAERARARGWLDAG